MSFLSARVRSLKGLASALANGVICEASPLALPLSLPLPLPLPLPLSCAGAAPTGLTASAFGLVLLGSLSAFATAPPTVPAAMPCWRLEKFSSSWEWSRWLQMMLHKYSHVFFFEPARASRMRSVLDAMAFQPLNFSQSHSYSNCRSRISVMLMLAKQSRTRSTKVLTSVSL